MTTAELIPAGDPDTDVPLPWERTECCNVRHDEPCREWCVNAKGDTE